ncbi:hypothetical protein ACWGE1_02680 [Streptomyces sp. NPDC054932]
MNQRDGKPAGHRSGVERAAMAVLAGAAAFVTAGAAACTSVIAVYALT